MRAQRVHERRRAKAQKAEAAAKERSLDWIVTDHAVVRYIERVMGIDVAAIRREILPEKVLEQARALGPGFYPSGPCMLRIRAGRVITVLTKEECPE